VLLKGSLFYNIAYGCAWADEGRVRDAARQAGIADFIETLPRGYDTEVGERGATLSGGQRQRVAIARALVRDPRILIMDEATASLDADVEAQIQAALRRVFRGRTVLVIAHRLSTVRDAHRILVLDQGRVTEQGTHEELLARRGVYHRLYSLQFGAAGGGK
jgi:subfamily B ATP-binding cassette protein MsbA